MFQLDFDGGTLLPDKKTHLSFTAEEEITMLVSQKMIQVDTMVTLRQEAKKGFIVATYNKITGKNPMACHS